MNKENILLMVRHALTVIGVLLTQLNVTTDEEWKPLADALATGIGSSLVAVALLWSFIKAWRRKRQAALTSALLCLVVLSVGCITTPEGSKLDVDRVARIAGAAAYVGTGLDLAQNPDHRPAFAMAVATLKSLEDAKNYDAAALAQALSGLSVREFKGPEGALVIQTALMLWDEALVQLTPITKQELVAAVLPRVRSGIERALQNAN